MASGDIGNETRTVAIFFERCGNCLLYIVKDGSLMLKLDANYRSYGRYLIELGQGHYDFCLVDQTDISGWYGDIDYGGQQFSCNYILSSCYPRFCAEHSTDSVCNGTFEPVGGGDEDADFE